MTPLDRIRDQVTNNSIVLYMKGTPQFPQCGFSARAAQVLQACGVKDFLAVNVLADPEIFENLKHYANWPTFPQLYIKGELIARRARPGVGPGAESGGTPSRARPAG